MSLGRIKRIVTILFVSISLFFFIFYLAKHYENLPHISWNLRSSAGLATSLLLYLCNMLIAGFAWFILLKPYGQKISPGKAIYIVAFSQFGKYLPGNVGQHIGKLTLSKGEEFPLSKTIQAIIVETALLVVAGASISAIGLLFYDFYTVSKSNLLLTEFALLFLIALLAPKIVFHLINKYGKGFLTKYTGGEKLNLPNTKNLIILILLDLTTFLNLGLILNILSRTVFEFPENNFFFLTTTFAWSWILGYLAPGAPAGLGVREAIVLASLSTRFEPGIAIGLSILLRFITTIGDGIAFGIASLFRKNKTE
ncbi:hypothetical protein CH371_06375 [Leptospira wolffii]|uniref:Uncharacterized protein n=1 Tax=Leptospira wolffii TaxID=409998 RepID=A0A2M9ZH14_9LEPT|nr:lysylphosphatidylglycerol synthase domain-containing protein [Leptospira wolffii]PJZ67626.1 hypothetical protein CH371_06375 [Leptospira wolffii]